MHRTNASYYLCRVRGGRSDRTAPYRYALTFRAGHARKPAMSTTGRRQPAGVSALAYSRLEPCVITISVSVYGGSAQYHHLQYRGSQRTCSPPNPWRMTATTASGRRLFPERAGDLGILGHLVTVVAGELGVVENWQEMLAHRPLDGCGWQDPQGRWYHWVDNGWWGDHDWWELFQRLLRKLGRQYEDHADEEPTATHHAEKRLRRSGR